MSAAFGAANGGRAGGGDPGTLRAAAPAAPLPTLPAPAAPAHRPPPLKRHQRVVDTVTIPADFERRRLPTALLTLLPQRFKSETAAKKACRRGEVLVDGEKTGTEAHVTAGACIEVRAAVTLPRLAADRPPAPFTAAVDAAFVVAPRADRPALPASTPHPPSHTTDRAALRRQPAARRRQARFAGGV